MDSRGEGDPDELPKRRNDLSGSPGGDCPLLFSDSSGEDGEVAPGSEIDCPLDSFCERLRSDLSIETGEIRQKLPDDFRRADENVRISFATAVEGFVFSSEPAPADGAASDSPVGREVRNLVFAVRTDLAQSYSVLRAGSHEKD